MSDTSTSHGTAVPVVIAASIGAMSGNLPVRLVGGLAVQMGVDFDLTPARLGAAATGFAATSAVSAIALSRVVERYGWSKSLRIATIGSAAVLMGISIAPSLLALYLLLAVGGLCFSLVTPASNVAMLGATDLRRRGLFFGVKQASTPAATLLAGLAIPVIAGGVNWRWVFVVAVVLPVGAAWLGDGTRRVSETLVKLSSSHAEGPSSSSVLAFTVAGSIAIGIGSALAAFLAAGLQAGGLASGRAGALLAVGSFAAIIIRITAGWAVDLRRSPGTRPTAIMMGGGALGCVLLAVGNGPWMVAGALLAATMTWGWPGLYHLATVNRHPSSPARASGVAHMGLTLGAAVGPLGFGLIAEHASYTHAWSAAALVLLLASCLMLWAATAGTE